MMNSAGNWLDSKELNHQLAHWDEDRRGFLTSITTAFFVIAFITVILRLMARWKKRQHLQWDDYLMIISLVSPLLRPWVGALNMHAADSFKILDIGLFAETLLRKSHPYLAKMLQADWSIVIHFGTGIHSLKAGIPKLVKNIQVQFPHPCEWIPQPLNSPIQVVFAMQLTYNLVHLTIKTSILFLYKRIFTFMSRRFKYTWYAVLCYVVSCAIVGLAICFGSCKPFRYFWEKVRGMNGTCIDLTASELGPGVATMVADVVILIMPIPLLWSLQIKRARKIQFYAIFGIGFLWTKSFRELSSNFLHNY